MKQVSKIYFVIVCIGILVLGIFLYTKQSIVESVVPILPDISTTTAQTIAVKTFFGNTKLLQTGQDECTTVFSVDREVPYTLGVARAALEELLKGPTASEITAGYTTSLNIGVKIQSLTIENGIAKVDFDKRLDQAVGGSCRVTAIRRQIVDTLKQFATVRDVVISIDGRTEDILQP